MRQHKLELRLVASIRKPIPIENALAADRQIVPIRRHDLQKILEVIIFDVGVDQLLASPIHHADVHLACMEIDSAVEFCLCCVILHLELLLLWCH